MSDRPKKLRTLFCCNVKDEFFNLPSAEIGVVWAATGELLKSIRNTPGVDILGTLDDDQAMVGVPSNGWPWTFYILADVPNYECVVTICNYFRTSKVGEFLLWRYIGVEARTGRELVVPT